MAVSFMWYNYLSDQSAIFFVNIDRWFSKELLW